jgi:hypothetical protein
MASDDALDASAEHRETSTEQLEESLGGQQMVALVEASSSCEAASDHKSQSRDLEHSETDSDTSMRLKVVVAATLVGTTYDYDKNPPQVPQKPGSLLSQGIWLTS